MCNNLNSTDEVSIEAISGNITQDVALIGPYGLGSASEEVYLPEGNYTFKYTELNYSTGQHNQFYNKKRKYQSV